MTEGTAATTAATDFARWFVPPRGTYQLQATNGAGQDRQYHFVAFDVSKHHPHGAFSGIAQMTHASQVLDTGEFGFTARGEQLIDI